MPLANNPNILGRGPKAPPGGTSPIGGNIAATQVAYGSAANTIKGEGAFTYNETTNALTLGGNLTFGTSASILNGTTGSQGITVTGTNQSITLKPSGTGSVVLGAVGSATGAPSTVGLLYGTGGGGQIAKASLALIRTDTALPSGRIEFRGNTGTAGAGWAIKTDSSLMNSFDIAFVASGTFSEAYNFSMRSGGTSLFGGNLLLGGLTTDGTGVLQFPAATTSAGGLNFGTEIFFFRTGTNTAQISASAGLTVTGNITKLGGAALLTTSSALTDGAGVALGTLDTAPTAGNPTKWIGINDNGTTRYIPAW